MLDLGLIRFVFSRRVDRALNAWDITYRSLLSIKILRSILIFLDIYLNKFGPISVIFGQLLLRPGNFPDKYEIDRLF